MKFASFVLLFFLTGCAATRSGVRVEDAALFHEPEPNAVTFWGHACAYVDVGGFGIVTDPVFETSYVPLRPRIVPVPPPAAYDQTRVILISHAHQDHLDRRTLERFSPGVVILCPAPAARYLHALDRDVRIMRPGDSYAIPGGRIVAVSALHPGGRYGIHATRNGDALGWVIETREHTIYYSGDTGYFDGFANVGRTYQPDVALLNVNAHLHSEDALAAAVDLGMPTIVPLHYGAYWSPKEKKSSGWRAQLADWLGPEMHAVGVGQSWALDAAASRYDSSSARPESLAPPAIARFAVIDSGLARGARPSAAAVTDLAHRGYRTVVSLLHDPAEEARVRAAGMAYVEIPMSASMFGASVPSDHDLERFFDVVLDSTARPVYMHCVHGKDRTGAMAALYRIEVSGWSSEKALAEMDRMGFNGWYRTLRRFVRDYEPRGYAARRKVAGAE